MPCYDNSWDHVKYVEEDCVPRKDFNALVDQGNYKEAVLCALFNELSRRGILTEVIARASESGQVDIASLYAIHRTKDFTRMRAELEKYSEDEIEIIKEILNGKENKLVQGGG